MDSGLEREKLSLLKSGVFKANLIRVSENENLPNDLYLPRQIFLFPVPIKIAARATKMVLSKRRCPLKLVFALRIRDPANWRDNIIPPEGCQGLKGLSPYDFLRREVWIDRN